MPVVTLPNGRFRTDGGTQRRVAMDLAVVEHYRDLMAIGTIFPPIEAHYDGEFYWVVNGFHRLEARKQSGHDEITADITDGTLAEAIWASCAANKGNGLQRSNADKAEAIRAALDHAMGLGLSNEAIADWCGVSPRTVSKYRGTTPQTAESTERKGLDGRVINTGRIGEKQRNRAAAGEQITPALAKEVIGRKKAEPTQSTDIPVHKPRAIRQTDADSPVNVESITRAPAPDHIADASEMVVQSHVIDNTGAGDSDKVRFFSLVDQLRETLFALRVTDWRDLSAGVAAELIRSLLDIPGEAFADQEAEDFDGDGEPREVIQEQYGEVAALRSDLHKWRTYAGPIVRKNARGGKASLMDAILAADELGVDFKSEDAA